MVGIVEVSMREGSSNEVSKAREKETENSDETFRNTWVRNVTAAYRRMRQRQHPFRSSNSTVSDCEGAT